MGIVRVWWDRKRDCYVSNAAFVAASRYRMPVLEAAQLLKAYFDARRDPERFEEATVS